MERASLYCLKLLETALQKQQSYLSALRQSSGSVLGSRMDKLLLAINARSGRSDHLVNIAKLVASCCLSTNDGPIPKSRTLTSNIQKKDLEVKGKVSVCI